MFDSTITPEGGSLETPDSDMIVDVCKGSASGGSQLFMETSSLQKFEEVPLHQDSSSDEVNLLLSHPFFVGTLSAYHKLSDTVQISERLDPNQEKGEVERERTLDGSSEIERVGAQPHYEGKTRIVTPTWGYWDQLLPTDWSSDLHIDDIYFQIIRMYEK